MGKKNKEMSGAKAIKRIKEIKKEMSVLSPKWRDMSLKTSVRKKAYNDKFALQKEWDDLQSIALNYTWKLMKEGKMI